MSLIVSLDLGQQNDYCAMVIGEKKPGPKRPSYEVRHIDRWRDTPYTDTVGKVVKLVTSPKLAGCTLVVDQTGVGRAVVDMFRAELPCLDPMTRAALATYDVPGMEGGVYFLPVTITSGHQARWEDGRALVPKRDLVGCAQTLMQQKRLLIGKQLKYADVLAKELLNFKVKITASANETFAGDWREGEHDDLALALCMCCWAGEYAPCGSMAQREVLAGPTEQDVVKVTERAGGEAYMIGDTPVFFPDDDLDLLLRGR